LGSRQGLFHSGPSMVLGVSACRGSYGLLNTDDSPCISAEPRDLEDTGESDHGLGRWSFLPITAIFLLAACLNLTVVQFGGDHSVARGPAQVDAKAEELPFVGLRSSHGSDSKTLPVRSKLKSFAGDNWWLKQFPPDEIAANMLYTNCRGDTAAGALLPPEFGGLWWMDGNHAPATVVSFGRARWEYGDEACQRTEMESYSMEERARRTVRGPFGEEVPCQGRMSVELTEDRIWAMPGIAAARAYEHGGTASISAVEFVCGGEDRSNLTICKFGSNTGPKATSMAGQAVQRSRVASDWASDYPVRFSMVKVNANYWVCYSLDGVHVYHLKRIVGCNGRPVKKQWEQFLSDGTARPERLRDVFGHGGDERTHVEKVTGPLFVRWNTDPKLEGSG